MNWGEYKEFDKPSKEWLMNIIHKNSDYRLFGDLDEELYKDGDLVFKKGNKRVIFELEVRHAFDDIVNKYNTIHIPIRKKNTPANFYVVLKPDFQQFILIKNEIIKKYADKITNVRCSKERFCDTSYTEEFLDIKKSDTQWYVVSKNHKLIKLNY